MKENIRNNNFGVLHLLAALFVMYGHQCALLGEAPPMILGSQIQAIGVKMIFLISGYFIMKSLFAQGEHIKKAGLIYAVKRIGRLYPEYIFCLIITALVIGPIFSELTITEYFAGSTVWDYIFNNIRLYITYNLPGMFQYNPYVGAVNGSLWTMPVEVFMYVVFFICFILVSKIKNGKYVYGILVCIIVTIFLGKIAFFSHSRFVVYATDWMMALNVVPYMFIGGIYYFYDIRKYLSVQWSIILLLGIGFILFNTEVIREFICIIILPYIVFSIGFSERQELRFKFLKSEYSYGIYLWGFVVQQCLIQKFFVECTVVLTRNFLFAFSVTIAYLLAMMSYEFVYIPFSKYSRKLIERIS